MRLSTIKQNLIYLLSKMRLTYCDISLPKKIETYDVDVSSMEYLIHTTNNIIRISDPRCKGFFRECKKHISPKSYTISFLKEYFLYCSDFSNREQTIIIKDVSRNFRIFFSMGIINDPFSRVARFFKTGDGTYVGIDNRKLRYDKRLKDLVDYCWSEIYSYRLNSGCKKGQYHGYSVSRALAEERLANLFGFGDMFPSSKFIKIKLNNGMVKLGLLSSALGGEDPAHMNTNDIHNAVSPQIQLALLKLNVLDTICNEKDHRPGNYFLTSDRIMYNGLGVFDNDSPMSFSLSISCAVNTYMGGSQLFAKNGHYLRPFFDDEFVDVILSVRDDVFRKTLCGIVNKYQIFTALIRLHSLQKSIIKLKNECPKRIIAEWNYNTIQEELDYCKKNNINSYLSILYFWKN